MEKLYCETSNDGETYFYIHILETGWIYDVFLILTSEIKPKYEEYEFKKIPVQYSGKEIINGNTFSTFEVYHQIDKPTDFMVSFFIYTINGITYKSEPMYFSVKDEK